MKTVFYWLLGLWIVGGTLARIAAGPAAQSTVVNLFGIPAIIVGIILLIRWIMNRNNNTTPEDN